MSVLIRPLDFCPICNSRKVEKYGTTYEGDLIQHCPNCSRQWYVKGDCLIK